MNMFYIVVIFCLKLYFSLFYRLKITGLENLPKGPAIIAPNHVSFFDPPIIAASCKEEVYFLARSSLFEQPFWGGIIKRLNAYPVAGTAQDLASMKLICQLLKENKKVTIFPEGIRSEDGELAKIKSGIGMLAMRSEAPIVPVYIDGTFDAWNKFRKFPKPWGKISCSFGKPIYPADFVHLGKKQAQDAIAHQTEQEIRLLKAKALK